jgi:ABC-type sugar transport system permease subunit
MIRRRLIVTFLFPALALYIGFMIYPAILAVKLSFYETSGFGDQQLWVGLGNYKRLAADPIFWKSLQNTLLILIVGGIGVFGFAFLFSVFLNSGIWGKKFFRAIIFMPNAVAVIAISTFWSFMYTPRYGLLPNFFHLLEDYNIPTFGLDQVLWTSPENIFFSMMVGLVWVGTGFFTILILAGVDKIPVELVEAGRIEGASDFQIFRHITLPMISDVVLITIVLWCVQAVKVFEYPYAFGGPNIDTGLYTNAIYLYIQGFGQRDPIFALGYATALGVVMVLLTILIVIFFRIFKPAERIEF